MSKKLETKNFACLLDFHQTLYKSISFKVNPLFLIKLFVNISNEILILFNDLSILRKNSLMFNYVRKVQVLVQ